LRACKVAFPSIRELLPGTCRLFMAPSWQPSSLRAFLRSFYFVTAGSLSAIEIFSRTRLARKPPRRQLRHRAAVRSITTQLMPADIKCKCYAFPLPFLRVSLVSLAESFPRLNALFSLLPLANAIFHALKVQAFELESNSHSSARFRQTRCLILRGSVFPAYFVRGRQ
jgi:hypothetical protein